MSAFFTNSVVIQVSDTVRLIFQDVRQGVPPGDWPVSSTVGEAILSMGHARALRDLLVEYVKDDPAAPAP